MANRPFVQAYIDRNATNIDPDYASNQLTLEGFQPKQPIPSRIINTLFLVDALWLTYIDYGTVRTTDYLEAVPQRWSATKLSYNIGDSVITGGASPITSAVYYFENYRIEIDECILKPAGADPLLKPSTLKPGRIWLYLDTSLIVDPAVPFASVRTEEAGPGVADTPGAGELTIGGVEIDAAGLITGNIYAAVEPTYELVYDGPTFRWKTAATFEGGMQFDGNVKIDGTLDVDGNATIGAGVANVHTVNGSTTIGTDNTNTHSVKGNATIGEDKTNTLTVKGNATVGTDNTNTHSFNGAVTANNAVTVTGLSSLNGAATAGDGTQAVGLSAQGLSIALFGQSTAGDGVKGQATDGGANAVHGESMGDAAGVRGKGGPSGASEAGVFTSGHVNSNALVARTIASASSTGAALFAFSEGDATAVSAKANENGYAVFAVADLGATPVRTAMRIAPQLTDPSSAFAGDYTFVSDRGPNGKLRIRSAVGFESAHSTPLGRVDAISAEVSGSIVLGGTTGDIATVSIAPEVIGDVLVTVMGTADFDKDGTRLNISLRDVTAGTTINGGGTGIPQVANFLNSIALGGRDAPILATKRYTLPSASARVFAVDLGSNLGATEYTVIVTVTGLY